MIAPPTFDGAGRLLLPLFAWFAAVVLASAADDASGLRTWSDRSGKFAVSASLTRIEGGKVTLRREDGQSVTLEMTRLADADLQYIAEVMAGRSAALEFDVASGEVKLRQQTTVDTSRSTTPGPGFIESESNVGIAPLLTLSTASDAWSYHPDGVAAEKIPESKQVRLMVDPKATPSKLSITVLPGSKQALVSSLNRHETFASEECRLMVCDLAGGKVELLATASGEKLLAVSPDGKWIAMAKVETLDKPEIRLYRRDGIKLMRFIVWRPYFEEQHSHFGTSVEWATFLGNDRLLTISNAGLLALWEVPDVQPRWCMQLDRGAAPAISPGGKFLALVADKKLMLIDLESTRVVGSIPTDIGGCRLAFRADGRRVAGIAGDEVCVWNLESQQTYRDFNLFFSVDADEEFAWIDDDHLLVGSSVVDIDRRVPIWKHVNTLGRTIRDGRLWFVAQPGTPKELKLASTRAIPQLALDAVAKLKPEELLLIGPGTEVALEISASGDVQSARDVLERKLKDNGMKVVSSGNVRLIGTVQPGETKQIQVIEQKGLFPAPTNPFDKNPRNAGTMHNVAEYSVNLCFKIGEETVWRRSYSANLPPHIQLKDGETVDQAIQRLTYLDASYLTRYALPKCLARLPKSVTK